MALATATIIAGIGVAVGAGSLWQASEARNDQNKANRKAEAARELAMNLDALRRRRAVIRQTLAARSSSLANAAGQGSVFGSGLAGGMAQAMSSGNSELSYSNKQQQVGSDIFSFNRQAGNAATSANNWGSLSSLGGMIIDNSKTLGRLGDYTSETLFG
jgi:hypothetical protein